MCGRKVRLIITATVEIEHYANSSYLQSASINDKRAEVFQNMLYELELREGMRFSNTQYNETVCAHDTSVSLSRYFSASRVLFDCQYVVRTTPLPILFNCTNVRSTAALMLIAVRILLILWRKRESNVLCRARENACGTGPSQNNSNFYQETQPNTRRCSILSAVWPLERQKFERRCSQTGNHTGGNHLLPNERKWYASALFSTTGRPI